MPVAREPWIAAWREALTECDAATLTAAAVDAWPASFRRAERRWLLSVGKAAVAMHAAARTQLGPLDRELVITPEGVAAPHDWGFVMVGDHPVVTERSLAAGAAALAFAEDARQAGASVWGLVSGGSSALCEAPGDGIDAHDVLRFSREGLAAGLSIEALNAARSRLSAVKAGRLADAFGPALKGASVLVDIPSGRPEVVGSGPLAAPGVRLEALGTPSTLAAAFAKPLEALGFRPHVPTQGVDQTSRCWTDAMVDWLGAAKPGEVWVGGGEIALEIPTEAIGRSGGRARHTALSTALAVRERRVAESSGWVVFAAASDGRDGAGGAGALITSDDLRRVDLAGARRALASFDSGRFCGHYGLALEEHPPTTNLCDVYAVARIG